MGIDWLAFWILMGISLGVVGVKLRFRSPPLAPAFGFSQKWIFSSLRTKWVSLPEKALIAALFLWAIAFLDPHFMVQDQSSATTSLTAPHPVSTEGLALYLLIDQSGSMGEKPKGWKETKLDLVKEIATRFIQDRSEDLIGLIAFARVPRILSPLTLDQAALLDQLHRLEPTTNPEENGTAIGYAIYKAAHLIASTRHFAEKLSQSGKDTAYAIKGARMILITDGFQDPSSLDYGNRLRTLELDDAAAYAKEQGIQLLVFNIDPTFASPGFAPQRRQMEQITRSTGGDFFLLTKPSDLQLIYQKLGVWKKEQLTIQGETKPDKKRWNRISLFPFFIGAGLLFYAIAICFETLYLKKIP